MLNNTRARSQATTKLKREYNPYIDMLIEAEGGDWRIFKMIWVVSRPVRTHRHRGLPFEFDIVLPVLDRNHVNAARTQ